MIVSATCGGGYAGITQSYRIDTGSAPDGAAVEALVAQAFATPSAAAAAPQGGADLQQWAITVDDGGRAQTVTFTDPGAAAQQWRPLLTRLRAAPARY